MGELSERLRAAREDAGLSIDEISERTRIKADLLRALERGDVSRLPGTFYTKTFIRAYAREVGLPGDALVAEFLATQEPPAQPAVRVEDIGPVRRIARFESPRASTWQLVPIAAVVAAVVFFGSRPGPEGARVGEPGAVGTAGVAAAEPAPATAPMASRAAALVLDIRPSGPVWVAATGDGKQAIYRLLNPGERVRVEAREEISLRVGDAAAFAYSINGVEGLVLGAPGEVRDVRITRDNYGTFRR